MNKMLVMNIRTYIMLLFFFLNTNLLFGQVENCYDFKTGVFQFLAENGGVYTIIRTDTSQFEKNTKEPQHSKMKIRWESECSYTLYERTEYKWRKQPTTDTLIKEINNIVYRFEKPDKFYVKTFVQGYSDTSETVFKKLDTSKYCYNNLFQLQAFAEFKNSKSYAQTLLGEIHSIDYYESNTIPNKYIIIFETTFEGELLNRTRLLDSVIVNLKSNEKITNSDCRFKDEFDDEIVAIYNSENEKQEAKIIKAFRCNRNTEKIEEIDILKVKYKEVDRQRIKLH